MFRMSKEINSIYLNTYVYIIYIYVPILVTNSQETRIPNIRQQVWRKNVEESYTFASNLSNLFPSCTMSRQIWLLKCSFAILILVRHEQDLDAKISLRLGSLKLLKTVLSADKTRSWILFQDTLRKLTCPLKGTIFKREISPSNHQFSGDILSFAGGNLYFQNSKRLSFNEEAAWPPPFNGSHLINGIFQKKISTFPQLQFMKIDEAIPVASWELIDL